MSMDAIAGAILVAAAAQVFALARHPLDKMVGLGIILVYAVFEVIAI